MTLKSQINDDLNSLSPDKLTEAYHYISLLKKNDSASEQFFWKKYLGILSKVEAKNLLKTLKLEFGKIEGEW